MAADEPAAVYSNRGGATFKIYGTLIGHGDSVSDGRDRWVDVDLFRTDTGDYAVHRAGMSRVYHRVGNATCTLRGGQPKGLLAVRADLPEGAVSCDVCEPPYPEELEDDEAVLFEFPRHSVKSFATPQEAVTDLFSVRGDSGRGFSPSRPAMAALAQARKNDEGFSVIGMEMDIR